MTTDSQENKRSIQEKLYDKYRLVILDDDTLGEIKSIRFSIFGILATFIGSVVIIVLLTFVLISFTPLRYVVPGYADIENNQVYMELNQKLDDLEEEIEAQRVYTNGLKNILNPSGKKLNIEEGQSGILPEFQDEDSNSNIELTNYYMMAPLKGSVSAAFNLEKNHFGVDIVAPKDTPVKSILDGVVINADWTNKTGNTISIQHSNNIISIFKHNSKLLKKSGEVVKKGEAIAIIGNTGELSTGPHVHFELWNKGVVVNPEHYISFN